jgi:3-oxoacyl-[acyl-carrier-protein] synthase-3
VTAPTAGIRSIGWYVPSGRRDVSALARDYGVTESAVTGFGLRGHTVASPDEHPSTMGAHAVREALAAAHLETKDIALLIFCGITRDYPPPWVAAFGVLHELGAKGTPGFDLSNRCAGLHDALWTARALALVGGFDPIVVCCADRYDYLLGPPRRVGQVGDVAYSAGAAAAVVSRSAKNELAAYSFLTHEDLSLHDQGCPRAGASRGPLDAAALEADLHRWQSTMTVSQGVRLRKYMAEADRHNIESVCRAANFDAIDFLACSPLDVKAQLASLAQIGVAPEQTLFTLPELGHMGSTDALVSLGLASAIGRPLGRRVVMSTRTVVYSNALALRALGEDVAIASGGVGLNLDEWRESERSRLSRPPT